MEDRAYDEYAPGLGKNGYSCRIDKSDVAVEYLTGSLLGARLPWGVEESRGPLSFEWSFSSPLGVRGSSPQDILCSLRVTDIGSGASGYVFKGTSRSRIVVAYLGDVAPIVGAHHEAVSVSSLPKPFMKYFYSLPAPERGFEVYSGGYPVDRLFFVEF